MRTRIKTTNITLTPDIAEYLEKRLAAFEKLTAHHSEDAFLDVEIGRTTKHHHSGDIYRAEINIHIGQKNFRAVQETGDLHSSIDAAKDQMMDELRSEKGKRMSLIRHGGQKVKAFIKGIPWWKRQS